MTKPTLQPEHSTVSDSSHVVKGAVVEIRNITLKEALRMVKALADGARPEEVPSSTKP
ncbi:MAG: hypothetical protein JO119_02105 [Acidobacteria bacterium]|nr:hypothetical protein [Acidobacteriota bacterium]